MNYGQPSCTVGVFGLSWFLHCVLRSGTLHPEVMTDEVLYRAKRVLWRDKYRTMAMFIRVELCQLWVIASATGCSNSSILAEVAVNAAKDVLGSCLLARSSAAAVSPFKE